MLVINAVRNKLIWRIFAGVKNNRKVIEQFYLSGTSIYNQYDTEENQYSFNGKITQVSRKNYLSTSASSQLTINTWNIYDQMNRPLLGKQQYITSTNTGGVTTLSKVDYNELGQPLIKHLGSTNTAANPANNTFLQHINYTYNARGSMFSWLLIKPIYCWWFFIRAFFNNSSFRSIGSFLLL